MNLKFWEKLNLILGILSLVLIFKLAAQWANLEIKDLDIWFHLKMGKVILEQGYVPNQDIFSYALGGKAWIDHEWLFQIIVYFIYLFSGFNGLIILQVILVECALLLLLLLTYKNNRQFLSILGFLLVFLVFINRFIIRPDLFSLLFFVLYLHILTNHLKKKWSLGAVLFIQILWTNIHGFFFLGPLLITLMILGEGIKRFVTLPFNWNTMDRLSSEEYVWLQVVWIFSIFACFVNPYFITGAMYPIEVLKQIFVESNIFFQGIEELQKPIVWENIFKKVFIHYKLIIIFSFLCILFNYKKINITYLLFWVFFLIFSLTANRNIVYFAFIALVVIMQNGINLRLEDIVPIQFKEEKFKYVLGVLIKIILIQWLLNFGVESAKHGYFDFETYKYKSDFGGISKRLFPKQAVDFLVKHKIKGNFFNDFNSGSYLVGRSYPNIKVFIDGRTELYGEKFCKDYLKIWAEGNKELFNKFVKDYHITGAFLNVIAYQLSDNLLKMFYNDKKWIMVYFNYDAVIFLKDVPENREIINQNAIDLTQWKVPSVDLYKIGFQSVNMYMNINRAFTLYSLKFYDEALEELDWALAASPNDVQIYRLLGSIYTEKKEFYKAFINFRIAASLDPFHLNTMYKLAVAYENVGKIDEAIKQFNFILANYPKIPLVESKLVKLFAIKGMHEDALRMLETIYDYNPDIVSEILNAGDLFFIENKFDNALKIYFRLLEVNKDLEEVHYKIGKTYQAMGEDQKAKEYFHQCFVINPNYKELK